MTGPSLKTRAADRANAVVWRLPLPRRAQALLSQLVYRNPPISSTRVVEALNALDQAGIETVLIGGWGVDALVGKQLRPHRDLDLLTAEHDLEAGVEALRTLGFEPWNHKSSPGPIGELVSFSVAQNLRDSALRVVELHAVDLEGFETEIGSIAGRPVTCLTAEHQMRAQRLVGRTWTRAQRLKHQRNVAAILMALQQGSQNL